MQRLPAQVLFCTAHKAPLRSAVSREKLCARGHLFRIIDLRGVEETGASGNDGRREVLSGLKIQ